MAVSKSRPNHPGRRNRPAPASVEPRLVQLFSETIGQGQVVTLAHGAYPGVSEVSLKSSYPYASGLTQGDRVIATQDSPAMDWPITGYR